MTDHYTDDTEAPQVREITITKDVVSEVISGTQPLPIMVLVVMVALVVLPFALLLHPRIELHTILTFIAPACALGIVLGAFWIRRLGSRSRALIKRAFPVGATVTATDEDDAFELHTPAGTLDFGWEETKATTLNHTVLLRREDGMRLAIPRALIPGTTALRFGSGLAASFTRLTAKKPNQD